MPSEPLFPEVEDLIEFNRAEVAETGENFALLNRGLLESAVMVPQNLYHYGHEEDVLALACSLMVAVARNHPFEQGNKRTAFDAGMMLLELNGYRLVDDIIEVALALEMVVDRTMEAEHLYDVMTLFIGRL